MSRKASAYKALALGAVAWGALLGTGAVAETFAEKPAMPDAQMAAVLKAQAELGVKPIPTLSVSEARKQPTVADGVKEVLANEHKSIAPQDVGGIDNVEYPSDGNTEVKARIYHPANAGDGMLPVIVYYHGGGWVIGNLDAYDATPRALADGTGAVVVSCDYRNGPENKFPTAHNDAVNCYHWAVDNVKKFNGDLKRIAVAGESAGGNMAVNVAIAARDHEIAKPIHELLVYPVAGGGLDQQSYRTYTDPKLPLNAATVKWMLDHYISSSADEKDPRLDLVDGADLGGLPPTTLITAEIDPLNTEGRVLARKLMAAGVPVNYSDFPGVTHEFFGGAAVVDEARKAQTMANTDLKAAFAGEQPGQSLQQP